MVLKTGGCFWEEQSGCPCRCVVISPQSPPLVMVNRELLEKHTSVVWVVHSTQMFFFPPSGKDGTG